MNKLNLITAGMLSLLCCAGAQAQITWPDPVKLEYLSAGGKVVFTTSDADMDNSVLFNFGNASLPGYPVNESQGRVFSSVRFTPWAEVGDQPVAVCMEDEAPAGMGVTYEVVDDAQAPGMPPMRVQAGELTLPPGTHLRFRIELPEGYMPVVNYNYDYTRMEGDASLSEEGVDLSPIICYWIRNYMGQKGFRSNMVASLESETIGGFRRVAGTANTWTWDWWTGMIPEKYVFGAEKMDADHMRVNMLAPAFDKMFGGLHYMDLCSGQQWHNGESYIMNEIGECLSGDTLGDSYILDIASNWSLLFSMTDWDGNYVWHSWTWHYAMELIQCANFGLYALREYTACSAEEIEVARAQLLVLRAHGYWRLLQTYAPRWEDSGNGEAYCAPWYDKFDDDDRPLATMNEIFSNLYDDLGEACAALSDASGSASEMCNLPDYQTAAGVWARIALLKHDWQKAAECAREARAHTSKYRISTNEELLAGYIEPDADWMWCSRPCSLIYGGSGWRWACNGAGATMHYAGSALAINKALFDSMEESDVRRRLFILPGNPDLPSRLATNMDYWTERTESATWFKSTGMRVLSLSLAKQASERGLDAYPAPYMPMDGSSDFKRYTQGSHLKFFTRGLVEDEQILFMRSTEMLLTEAEARCEMGDNAGALQLLNTLHQTRTGNAIADGSADLREAIRLERRLELWGEGFGWFDFKRWNLPIHRSSEAGFGTGAAAETKPSDANGWRFKIPVKAVRENALIDVRLMNYSDYSMYETTPAAPAKAVKAAVLERPLSPNFSLTH